MTRIPMTRMQVLLSLCLAMFLFLGSATAAEKLPPIGETTKYTCPMHPHYIADEMGTCPICGMDLVPMQTGPATTTTPADSNERALVSIPPETIQNMGVRYGRAEPALFGRRIRAYGTVSANERLRSEVSSRVAGWVEALNVTAVGDPISQGMELYRLFSPDLVAAQRDYISALERQDNSRIQSTAARLKSLGMDGQLLEQLGKQRKPLEQVPFYADSTGTLSELVIREGAYVKPGETLARIQDYRTVWINAAVAEKDLAAITAETRVRVILPNLPGREFVTTVDYIHPTVDPASRTGTIRLQLDNPDGLLRPGAYADILFEIGEERRLAVPDSALLIDSLGTYVVLALGEGRFQPQRVRTGLSSNGYTEIIEGVDNRARVVTSGQFLIDSESSLRESFQKLQRLKQTLADLPLSNGELAMVDHLVDAALYLHEALADGYDVSPQQLQPAHDIRGMLWAKYGQTRLGPVLEAAEQALAEAQQARTESGLLDALHHLVSALQPWVEERFDYYNGKGVALYRDSGDDRLWLQQGGKPYSPYGGQAVTVRGDGHA